MSHHHMTDEYWCFTLYTGGYFVTDDCISKKIGQDGRAVGVKENLDLGTKRDSNSDLARSSSDLVRHWHVYWWITEWMGYFELPLSNLKRDLHPKKGREAVRKYCIAFQYISKVVYAVAYAHRIQIYCIVLNISSTDHVGELSSLLQRNLRNEIFVNSIVLCCITKNEIFLIVKRIWKSIISFGIEPCFLLCNTAYDNTFCLETFIKKSGYMRGQ